MKPQLVGAERLVWVNDKLSDYGFKFVTGNLADLKIKMTVECLQCQTPRGGYIFRNRTKVTCSLCRESLTSKKLLEVLKPKIVQLGYEIVTIRGGFYKNAVDSYFDFRCVHCGSPRVSNFRNLTKHPKCVRCLEIKRIKSTITPFGYSYLNHIVVMYDDKTKFHKVKAVCKEGHESYKLLSGFNKPCLMCNPKENMWREDSIVLWLMEHRHHLKLLAYDKKRKRASIQCKLDGYLFVTNWHKFHQAFNDCAKCSKVAKLTAEEIREPYEKENYQVEVTDRTTARDKIPTICPRGHTIETNLIHFRDRGDRCLICYSQNKASKGEIKFMDWIEAEGYEVIRNDRKQLDGLEIDGYMPKHCLGIEHNGLYHHSLTKKPNTNYHKIKFEKAQKKGIRLFQFWEDEFIHKEDILKSMVLVKLKSPQVERIFARKCITAPVPIHEARAFLNENHLQGGYGGQALGLYHKKELVMVVTYGRHHRGGTRTVLQRLASKKKILVVGGMSKLISKLPRPLVTWSDNRYSTGASYQQYGFVLDGELRPDYQYFRNEGRYNYKRYSKQSKKLKTHEKALGKTETVLRAEQNYHRIYDAGKKRWVLL